MLIRDQSSKAGQGLRTGSPLGRQVLAGANGATLVVEFQERNEIVCKFPQQICHLKQASLVAPRCSGLGTGPNPLVSGKVDSLHATQIANDAAA
jgi:hypothetical protein